MKKKWLKPRLTIKSIGYLRFWIGGVIGLGYAIIFTLLFKVFLQTLFYWGTELDFFEWYRSGYSSLFVVTLSFSLSFCITTFLWTGQVDLKRSRTQRRWGLYSASSSISVLYIVLLFLHRLYILYSGVIYEWHMNYGVFLFLLPLFIYLYCWNLIRNIYSVKRMFWAISIYGLLTMIILNNVLI